MLRRGLVLIRSSLRLGCALALVDPTVTQSWQLREFGFRLWLQIAIHGQSLKHFLKPSGVQLGVMF